MLRTDDSDSQFEDECFLLGHFVRPKPKLFRQVSILVGKCLMSDHYFKHWVHVYICVLVGAIIIFEISHVWMVRIAPLLRGP